MAIYGLADGVNKEFKQHYGLVDGVNKQFQSIYTLAGGVNKEVYKSDQPIASMSLNKTNVTSIDFDIEVVSYSSYADNQPYISFDSMQVSNRTASMTLYVGMDNEKENAKGFTLKRSNFTGGVGSTAYYYSGYYSSFAGKTFHCTISRDDAYVYVEIDGESICQFYNTPDYVGDEESIPWKETNYSLANVWVDNGVQDETYVIFKNLVIK